ncbi:MAG: hypothetical protein WKG07_14330 [Hymenobacter sp.]
MEILAQTWSEHCKHKEFSGPHQLQKPGNGRGGSRLMGCSKPTSKTLPVEVDRQLRANGNDWLIKVFSDNAGRGAHQRRLAVRVEGRNAQLALGH